MTISSKGLKIMKSKIIYDNYTIYENGEIYNKYNKRMVSVDNGRGYLSFGLQIKPKGKRVYKTVHSYQQKLLYLIQIIIQMLIILMVIEKIIV